jgi:LuxR family maltose regulon positive regulatory protein
MAAVAGLRRHEATLDVRVSCVLLEVRRQLRVGTEARARTALATSLHLAEPKRLRRPFREAPSDVQALLSREARRGRNLGWLGRDYAEDHAAVVVPMPGRSIRDPHRRPGPDGDRSTAGTGSWPANVTLLQAPVVETLTDKEREVLEHLSNLFTTQEIADTMFISVNTVRTHVRGVLRKLGVSRRNSAVRRARDLGLLPT